MAEDFPRIEQLVIHGNVSTAKSQGYTKATSVDGAEAHYSGNPAFCMDLKVGQFKRNPDSSVQFTIEWAKLCKFPAKGSHYFQYKFSIYAGIYVGKWATFKNAGFPDSMVQCKTLLFTKPSGSANQTWAYGKYQATNVTISAMNVPWRLDPDEHIYLLIYNYSKCSCNQTNKNRPVYWQELDEYIPDIRPYIWRYTQIDANTQQWKLVRPFYIVRRIDGVKYWCSIEDESTPVYDMDGNIV